jgi:hypothetical protein
VSIPQQALFEQFVASLDHARTVSPFFKAKYPEFGHGSIVSKKICFWIWTNSSIFSIKNKCKVQKKP